MNPIRLVFYGTSSFAVPVLKRLASDDRFTITAVVTQPDRPAGRHAEPKASPVKTAAERLNLTVRQFESVKSDEAFASLSERGGDVAVVASFGQIIPQRLIDAYPHGMVNVHGSILPKYRGASPIAATILHGDTETGVTIMKMDAKMDHGPILATATEAIFPDDTAGSLHDRLAELGARILPDVLFDYVNGDIEPREQDHAAATTVKLLSREDGEIDWSKSATDIARMVRAYDPWPGTYTTMNGKRLKILRAQVGAIRDVSRARIVEEGYPAVVCGDGKALRLLHVQPEGRPAMDGKDFLRGYRDWTHEV
jgi:methionyl-tRNA formyltransferase